MNTPTPLVLSLSMIFLAAASVASGQKDLLSSWNFNDDLGAPHSQFHASIGSGLITTNWDLSNVGNNVGTSVNLLAGDTSGRDIAFSNGTGLVNDGRWFQFELSMAGYRDLEFSFAGRTTDTGFQRQEWSWSIDGTFYNTFATLENRFTPAYSTQSFSLAEYSDLDNALNVHIRVALSSVDGQTAPAHSGNNRFDNVHFHAAAIPEPSTLGLIAGGLALAVVILRRQFLS